MPICIMYGRSIALTLPNQSLYLRAPASAQRSIADHDIEVHRQLCHPLHHLQGEAP